MNATAPRATQADPFPIDDLRTTRLLLETNLAMTAAFDAAAVDPAGLDRDVADLLVRLATAPARQLRGVDIGRQLFINAARTSRLIDRGERAGLVERRADPDDRRAQQVTLTAAGEQAAREFAPLMLDVIGRTVVDTFTEQEISTLQALLTRLRNAARDLATD